MPRPRNKSPTPRCHKGRAIVDLYDGGKRRTITLSAWGSPEAEQEFARLLAERQVPARTAAPARAGLTVNEVLLAVMRWAETHYRTPDGKPTTEFEELKRSIRPVRELYGHTPASEFGPWALASVRQYMVELNWCRTSVNHCIDRVKRVFKWAAYEELIPVTVYQALRTLAGLRRWRTEVRESEPVKPVDPAHVAATLPFLTPHLRCMAELQRLTGMRPGEVYRLRMCEVDTSGAVWVYRPTRHKTAHHGKIRAIHIGPRAQARITAFLLADRPPPDGFDHARPNDPDQRDARLVMADAYQEVGREYDAELLRDTGRTVVRVGGCVVDPAQALFSPRRAREDSFRASRRTRKSKVQPSQLNRGKAEPRRVPAAEYTPRTYAHAVRLAAIKANVPHWHPNQLRHLFATEVRRECGLEAAQVAMGHARADVTQVYAERDERLAATVDARLG